MTDGEIEFCAEEGCLVLTNGQRIPFVKSFCGDSLERESRQMPVRKGRIGDLVVVDAFRDKGCSGVLVKQELARDDQYTGRVGVIQMVVCPKDVIYDVIIGNVPGTREPNDPDLEWCEAGAVTRAESEKSDRVIPLTTCPKTWLKVDRSEFSQMQAADSTLQSLRIQVSRRI